MAAPGLFLTTRYVVVWAADGGWYVERADDGVVVAGPYDFRADALAACERLARRPA